MRIPTDKDILKTIYKMYLSDFENFDRDNKTRSSKIYVPIECKAVAKKLKVDPDIVFGRLYYHLEKQYGYKQDDGSLVHFFTLSVGSDVKCVNFPLLMSVLAGLLHEHRKFWISTSIAVLALMVSAISLTVSLGNEDGSSNNNLNGDKNTVQQEHSTVFLPVK